MNEIVHMYSAFSGTFYTIPKSDVLLMPPGHYPLNSKPKDCKKCCSRGFVGRNVENLTYNLCSCVIKKLNLQYLKQIEDKHISE